MPEDARRIAAPVVLLLLSASWESFSADRRYCSSHIWVLSEWGSWLPMTPTPTTPNYRSERDAFEAGKISSGPNPYLTNSVEHYFEDGSSLPLPRCVFLFS